MMHLSQRKEQFSRSYILAVCAAAGYSTYKPEVDDDSVDLGVSARAFEGNPCRPRIDMQIKCSADDNVRGDTVVFPLKRKNYDDLRLEAEHLCVPRILVVVRVPELEEEWLLQSEDELAMRRCGYWYSLCGLPDTENLSSVTLHIPRSNRFDVENLRALIGRASRKEPL